MSIPTGSDTITKVHGGDHPLRAAVLQQDDIVTAVVLVAADWAQQDPATRYSPGGTVRLLGEEEDHVATGWSLINDEWVEPKSTDEAEPPAEEPPVTRAEYEELRAQLQELRAQRRR